MTDSKEVMDIFMKKISSNTFSKKHQPDNNSEYSKLFFDEQLKIYCHLIKSEVFNKIVICSLKH